MVAWGAEAQDGFSLAGDPGGVVQVGAGPGGAEEKRLGGWERDGYHARFGSVQESLSQGTADFPGVS